MFKNPKSAINTAKRQTTVLVVLAVSLLVLGSGGIYALQIKQSNANRIVDAKSSQVGTNQEISKRYQTTLDTYNSTIGQLQYIEPSVTMQAYVPTLVQQLQRMATADHLKLTTVRPSVIVDPAAVAVGTGDKTKNADVPQYKTMQVSLSVEGTYKQIMTFVYHMTKFPKIVSVQSLMFSPRGTAPGGPTTKTPLLGAEIQLQAFIFDDANSPALTVVSDTTTDSAQHPTIGGHISEQNSIR